MTLYKVLLFVHILAMATWLGGNIMLAFIYARVEGTGDALFRARFTKIAGIVGPIIGVSALLVLGTGIGMVLDSDAVELSQAWVWLGLALFGLAVIIGAAFFGPASGKIIAALEAGHAEEAERRVKTFNLVARLDVLLLIVIVGVMVFKPGA